MLMSLSHHIRDPKFVTSGDKCLLWEHTRDEPIKTFEWGSHSIHQVAYNPIESDLIGNFLSYYFAHLYIHIFCFFNKDYL